ncbi:MAG: hypothetical protein SGI86_12335 [Deltaproteobacteria bacterium]|nr:hypothetical protein [Deltaproteobacteria bacterium]
MKKETVIAILSAEGIKAQSGAYALPEDREAQVIVRAGETLTVSRIVRVEVADDYMVFENHRAERFFFDFDSIAGVRMNRAHVERSAGFGR